MAASLRLVFAAWLPLVIIQSRHAQTPTHNSTCNSNRFCKVITNITGGWAYSVFGFISIPMLPVPFILFKWGPQLRRRSRYGPGMMMGNSMGKGIMEAEEHTMEGMQSVV